jgi:hypothetical protein
MSESIEKIIANLSPQQAAQLMSAVASITSAAQARFGVSPSVDEVVATAMAKEAAYGGEYDVENALFQLSKEAPSVVAHLSGATETVATPRYAESGIVTAEDIAALPQHLRARTFEGATVADINKLDAQTRMSLSRGLAMPSAVRNPTLQDRRNGEVAAYEDSRPLDQMRPSERITYARRQANGGAE